MDSGNNRYELLFMDEDVSDPFEQVSKSKKQVKTASGAPAAAPGATAKAAATPKAGTTTTKKAAGGQQQQAGKENKPSSLNKNEKKTGGPGSNAAAGKQQPQKDGGNRNANNNNRRDGNTQGGAAVAGTGGNRSVGFKQQQQNGETREQRNNRRNARDNNNFAGGEQQQQRPFRDRDNRGPRNGFGNRKREFDRQSGSDKTGVKSIDKRDGAGAHNWGSMKEAIDDVSSKSDVDLIAEKTDESGNEQSNTEQTAAAPVEEETKELTLDEWKAQKQQRAKPQFNIRKAGEGEDTSQWKKMVPLNNNKRKDNESEEELEYDPAMYPQRVGRQQRLLDIQFNFNDGRRGPGGFGGRGSRPGGNRPGGGPREPRQGPPQGGERGPAGGSDKPERPPRSGGNAGGGRDGGNRRNYGGDKQKNIAPKVNDERQFPTLA